MSKFSSVVSSTTYQSFTVTFPALTLSQISGAHVLGFKMLHLGLGISGAMFLMCHTSLGTNRRQMVRDREQTGRDIPVESCAHEDLVGRHRLIPRNFMACLVDPGEAEIAQLPCLAANAVGRDERCIASGGELGRTTVRDGQAGLLSAHPVAGIITVPVHHVDLDATVQQICDSIKKPPWVRSNVPVKPSATVIETSGVVDRYAEGRENRPLRQITI